MKFTIKPNETVTLKQQFKEGKTNLKFIPFDSLIGAVKGLRIQLESTNGHKRTIPLSDTSIANDSIDISQYEDIWLEYYSCDKEYEVNFDVE